MDARFNQKEIECFTDAVIKDGFCILRDHFSRATLDTWREAFLPLLEAHVSREDKLENRGPARYYVTIPFTQPFADPKIYEDADILAIVERLVGTSAVMCQFASDTPLFGSKHQDVHRDAPPLFPETGRETPAFQLAVNFPLVKVTLENGPFEVARGTHMMSKEEGLRRLELGKLALEPITMQLGDVIVRDVRGLHRGTPNQTNIPRPMVVIGYSRSWLYRPEVSIRIPRVSFDGLSARGRELLRFNPVVESLDDADGEDGTERYQSFAY